MAVRSWIRKMFDSPSPRTIRKAPARCRLSVEALEDRAVPAVSFNPAVTYSTGDTPQSVAVGDFNGDGKQDLVTANYGGFNVSVLLGNGHGTFPTADANQGPVTANCGGLNAREHRATATGSFNPAVTYGAGSGPRSVAVGDFNGDGKRDLVTANSGSNNVSVLLGNGNGTFQTAVS